MRTFGDNLDGRSKVMWAAGLCLLVLALLALAAAATIHFVAGSPDRASRTPAATRTTHRTEPSISRAPHTAGDDNRLDAQIAQLRRSNRLTAATTAAFPKISGPATGQPDLFARAFAQRLLAQDYQAPRTDLLRWIQAESAPTSEPSVIGLVPADLRTKWAVFSVTGDQPSPLVPDATRWRALGRKHAHTTVHIQRLLEPVTWSTAVLSGGITDPGVTAREVDAILTLHTVVNGHPHESSSSVALTMNLEGPPTCSHWGFVTAVTYNTAPLAIP